LIFENIVILEKERIGWISAEMVQRIWWLEHRISFFSGFPIYGALRGKEEERIMSGEQ
jgi:hypothetical protein